MQLGKHLPPAAFQIVKRRAVDFDEPAAVLKHVQLLRIAHQPPMRPSGGQDEPDALRLRFKQRLPGPFADMVCSACSLQQRTIHITHDRADLHA